MDDNPVIVFRYTLDPDTVYFHIMMKSKGSRYFMASMIKEVED